VVATTNYVHFEYALRPEELDSDKLCHLSLRKWRHRSPSQAGSMKREG
jgi:hypothetical protein